MTNRKPLLAIDRSLMVNIVTYGVLIAVGLAFFEIISWPAFGIVATSLVIALMINGYRIGRNISRND